MDSKIYKWAVIENISIIAAITVMYCLWHTVWPFLLLIFINMPRKQNKEG